MIVSYSTVTEAALTSLLLCLDQASYITGAEILIDRGLRVT